MEENNKQNKKYCIDCGIKITEELLGIPFITKNTGIEYKEGMRCNKCHEKKQQQK